MEQFADYMVKYPLKKISLDEILFYKGYSVIATHTTVEFFKTLQTIPESDFPHCLKDTGIVIHEVFSSPGAIPVTRYNQCQVLQTMYGLSSALQFTGKSFPGVTFDVVGFRFLVYLLLVRCKVLVSNNHSFETLNIENMREDVKIDEDSVVAKVNVLFLGVIESMFREFFEVLLLQEIKISPATIVHTTHELPAVQSEYDKETNFINLRVGFGIRRSYLLEHSCYSNITPRQFASHMNVLLLFPTNEFKDRESLHYLNATYAGFIDRESIIFCPFREKWILLVKQLSFDNLQDLFNFISTNK